MKDIVLELGCGIDINDAADAAVKLARENGTTITLVYNKIKIKVSPDTTTQYIIKSFFASTVSQPDMAMQQPVKKICYTPRYGYHRNHIEYGLYMARKFKLPVELKYSRKNMSLTPGDGYILNKDFLARLSNLATQCEFGDSIVNQAYLSRRQLEYGN